MFRILIWISVAIITTLTQAFAQNSQLQNKVKSEITSIENTVAVYKDSLKNQIDIIWTLEDTNQITWEEGRRKKDSIANYYAEKIKKSVSNSQEKIDEEIKLRVNEIVNSQYKEVEVIEAVDNESPVTNYYFSYRNGKDGKKGRDGKDGNIKKDRSEKRTTTQFVFATGINSLLEDGKLQNGEFTPLRSMFYELGYTHNTRIFKDSPLLHFKYGVSFMFDKLAARGNRIFVRDEQGIYSLEKTGIDYKKNMFRNTTLIVPLHLEFDFTKKKYSEKLNKNIFSSHKAFRLGVGGFIGTHLQTLEKNKYREDGKSKKEKISSSYNVEKFIYGLSAYVGYRETSFYVKYNLNPLFKNQPTDVNIISAGVRFDFN